MGFLKDRSLIVLVGILLVTFILVVVVVASTGKISTTRLSLPSDNFTYTPSSVYLAWANAPNLTQEDKDKALQIASTSDLYKEYIGSSNWTFSYQWNYPYDGNVYMSTTVNPNSNNSGILGFIVDIKNNSMVSSHFNDFLAIHFNNGKVTVIPPQNLTIMGLLYDAGKPVTSLLSEGFVQSGIMQNHSYNINSATDWSNDEYPLSLPFGNNSYSVGYAFAKQGYSEPWFNIGQPFWFRFEKWDNNTHTVVRYESNKQYMYNGQPINIDFAKDIHLVSHPYSADASYLIGLPDNDIKGLRYDFPADEGGVIPSELYPGQIYPGEFRNGVIHYNDYGVPDGTIFCIDIYGLSSSVDNSTIRPIGPEMLSSVSGDDYMQEYQYQTIDGKTHTSYVGISGRHGPLRLNIDDMATEFT